MASSIGKSRCNNATAAASFVADGNIKTTRSSSIGASSKFPPLQGKQHENNECILLRSEQRQCCRGLRIQRVPLHRVRHVLHRGSHRSNFREVVAASRHSSLSTRANRAVVAPIMFFNANDGGAEAIETFAGSTSGLDVAMRSIGCIAIVRFHVRIDRRAINRHQTSCSRLFVLLERRDRIVNGTGVLISPAKERGEVIECRQRQFSTRLTSRSDLHTNSPGDKWGIAKANKTKQTQYNNQSVG